MMLFVYSHRGVYLTGHTVVTAHNEEEAYTELCRAMLKADFPLEYADEAKIIFQAKVDKVQGHMIDNGDY